MLHVTIIKGFMHYTRPEKGNTGITIQSDAFKAL